MRTLHVLMLGLVVLVLASCGSNAPGPAAKVAEFSIADGSHPRGIVAGPDGNLWFTEYLVNQIGRITPAGKITEFPLPNANSRPQGITTGPDGNLWFVESGGNRIGRMTPKGVITEFSVPTANSEPYRITVGPEGALWFTQYNADQVGRLTPQ